MRALVRPLLLATLALTACPAEKAADAPAPAAAPAAPAAAPSAPAAPASQPSGAAPSAADGTKVAKGATPEDRDTADADGVVRRGEPLSAAKVLTVEEAFANAKALAGQSVKVQGKVASVCAKKGCWFEVKGQGDQGIRITAKNYGFFVPTQAVGMNAIIEGELSVNELDQATAQHYEDDKAEGTGKPAKKVEGPVAELGVVAAGLEMRQGG